MRKSANPVAAQLPPEVVPVLPPRDRLEFIRFRTPEDLRKALGIFREVQSADVYFTFREEFPPDTCVTNTATVRALQAHGLAFEWLTENI